MANIAELAHDRQLDAPRVTRVKYLAMSRLDQGMTLPIEADSRIWLRLIVSGRPFPVTAISCLSAVQEDRCLSIGNQRVLSLDNRSQTESQW